MILRASTVKTVRSVTSKEPQSAVNWAVDIASMITSFTRTGERSIMAHEWPCPHRPWSGGRLEELLCIKSSRTTPQLTLICRHFKTTLQWLHVKARTILHHLDVLCFNMQLLLPKLVQTIIWWNDLKLNLASHGTEALAFQFQYYNFFTSDFILDQVVNQ